MKKNKLFLLAALAALGLGAGYWRLAAQSSEAQKGAKALLPPVPVLFAQAQVRDLPVRLELVGRAEAYESVTLKSRVDGQVVAVDFSAGQHVTPGDVLVRLDPTDFAARLRQAEATVARDEAQWAKARADVARYEALRERHFVSEEKLNEMRTAEKAAAATQAADRAAVDLARAQLSHATLRAPFAGVVGARLAFPGTAVKTNDTALAVVNRIRPLYVTFTVPEKYLSRLRVARNTKVGVSLPGDKAGRHEGALRFIDNTVDAATGTIQMKALLENRDERLTPGQFMNVSLDLETLPQAVVIPTEAVQQGPEGSFVFVVDGQSKAQVRKIEVAATQGSLTAIGQGLKAGETVVTDGQLRLVPGAPVQAKAAPGGETRK